MHLTSFPSIGALVSRLADNPPPARGSSVGEVVSATIVAFIAIGALAAIGVAHRRRGVLRPLAELVEERTGLPAWSAIPTAIAGSSLVVAVFGYYWDVSWHIDRGRDPGAFANPAHWFIIIGLDGIAFAGLLALILGDRKTSTSVRLTRNWDVPVGGVLLAMCGVVALAGFPLDDIWHRLFGQDVTAWGPTHIQMIGGASLATLGVWALTVEGFRAAGDHVTPLQRRLQWVQGVSLAGAFLIGLSTLQVEFDFGVPQFRSIYHPILIMLAAGIGLVAARVVLGRGAAIGAALFFLGGRGLLTLAVGPLLGRSTQHIPLYIAEAVLVELVALVVRTERQITFGAAAGAAIGTVGLAAEWGWSHLWMPYPWHASMFPEAALLGLAAALAGGVVGGLIGRSLLPPDATRQPTPRGAAGLAWAAVAACLAIPMPVQAHKSWNATVTLHPVADAAGAAARVELQVAPAGAPQHADFFEALAWQGAKKGDGGLVLAPFHSLGGGCYATDKAVPLHGTWKTMVVLHKGDGLQDIPLYLPEDKAIPAPAVITASGTTTHFMREKDVLQREATGGNVNLQRAAYAGLTLLAMAWITAMAWGLRRLGPAPPTGTPQPRRRRPVVATASHP